MKSVKSFHRARRMWVYHRNTLMIAPSSIAISHDEWFLSLGLSDSSLEEARNDSTRGYVLANSIYAYSGDFKDTSKVRRELKVVVPYLVAALQLDPGGRVFSGILKQDTPGQWPALEDLGSTTDYPYIMKGSSFKFKSISVGAPFGRFSTINPNLSSYPSRDNDYPIGGHSE